MSSTPDTATDVDAVRRRLAEVRARIDAARIGDRPVTLVAVTKAFPLEVVRTAIAAGARDLGENYAQELEAKATAIAADSIAGQSPQGPTTPNWHFIGALQRNKVKLLAGKVHLWHGVDRPSLVDEIARRSPGDRILIQVNTTGEPQKSGCDPGEAHELVDQGRQVGLDVQGLMTVGPTAEVDPRPSFELLRDLGERCEVTELSMGMSGDFEIAVAAGATLVRVGSALFGPRPARESPPTQKVVGN